MTEYRIHHGDLEAAAVDALYATYVVCFEREPAFDLRAALREKPGVMAVIASDADGPLGYKVGYRSDPSTFYSWLGGVHPRSRRRGVGRELLRRQHRWCAEQNYRFVETQTTNDHKPMLLLNLREGFDIVGTKLDDAGTLKIRMRRALELPPSC